MKTWLRLLSLVLCLALALPAGAVTVAPSEDEPGGDDDNNGTVVAVTVGAVAVVVAILLWVGWRSDRDPDYLAEADPVIEAPAIVSNSKVEASFFAELGPTAPQVESVETHEPGQDEWVAGSVGLRIRF